jgi:hypothetical protein
LFAKGHPVIAWHALFLTEQAREETFAFAAARFFGVALATVSDGYASEHLLNMRTTTCKRWLSTFRTINPSTHC